MNAQDRVQDWSRPIYFLGENPVSVRCRDHDEHSAYNDRLLVLRTLLRQ